MTQQSKSYRYGKPTAPFTQRVVVNNASNGPSFFRKVKSFFDRDQSFSKPKSRRDRPRVTQRGDDSPRIPGGFFTADSSVELTTKLGRPQAFDKVRDISAVVNQNHQSPEAVDSDDESQANISNARLADFFSKKGSEPLTDIEMEGVLSLMKKAKSPGTSRKRPLVAADFDDSTTVESSRILKSSRTPSIATNHYKAPSFTPTYEDSVGSQSLGNASLRSTSSRRRVFDYSTFPTPYKTVVYKYSAADGNIGSRIPSSSMGSDISPDGLNPPSNTNTPVTQKLSNTASALVSLLDGDKSSEASLLCSNPYSSYVDPIREFKKSVSTSLSKPGANSPNSLRSEALEKIQDAKEDSIPQVLPKQRQKSQPKPSSERYKPARSSSLRSSIVPVEEVSKAGQRSEEKKPIVPTAAAFTFSLKGATNEKGKAEIQQSDIQQPDVVSFPDHVQPSSNEKAEKSLQKTAGPTINDKNDKEEHSKNPFSGIEQHKDIESLSRQPEDNSRSQATSGLFPPSNIENVVTNFDFGEPLPSNADPNLIDSAKVENLRSLFAF